MPSSVSSRLWYIISDIHGSYDACRNLLAHAQLIDQNNQWMGGKAQLFLLGDYVTTGPSSRQVIDLIRSLERQAPDQIVALLGNHELLLLRAVHDGRYRQEWLANPEHWQTIASWSGSNEDLDDLLRYLQIDPISAGAFAQIYQAVATTGKDSGSWIRRATRQWTLNPPAFSAHVWRAWRLFLRAIEEDGTLAWIEQLPVAYRQDEWGFFHAGPPVGFGGSVDDLNAQFNRLLRARRFDHPLLEPHRSLTSPIGTRRWWVETDQVDVLFNEFGIERCAFGHDPKAVKPRGILGQVWNKAVSTDAYMRAGIEGMIRIRGGCVDAICTDLAISILERIYPQQAFLTEERLIG